MDSKTEWEEAQTAFQRLSAFHATAQSRMSVLLAAMASSTSPFEDSLGVIQACHEESLVDLEKTGEVSFGAYLLERWRGCNKNGVGVGMEEKREG